MTGQGKGVSSCGVGLCQIKLRLNPDFTVSVTPGGSCAYRVPWSTSPYVRVMLQYADVTGRHRCLSKGRGTSTLQEMARNCCYLDFVLCQWGRESFAHSRGQGREEIWHWGSPKQIHVHREEPGKGNSRWRALQVPLFCDIGFPALLRTLFVASTAVGEGLQLLLFIAICCPYHALKECQASKI